MKDLTHLRVSGLRTLALIAGANAVIIAGWAIVTGAWLIAGLAAALTVPVVWAGLHRAATSNARMMTGVVFPLYAALALALAAGTSWQLDMHMLFFAYLAMLAILADWRVILVAAAVTAAHHLSLNFLASHLVFDGGPDILRAVYGGEPNDDGTLTARAGDTYIMFVEWDEGGALNSQSIHQFGSATLDEASPHFADQAPLFADMEMKPVLFEEEALEPHIAARYRPGLLPGPEAPSAPDEN